jgi:hypothetical protein
MVPVGCLFRSASKSSAISLRRLCRLAEHHRFSRVIVHGAKALVLGRLSGGRDHHLLSLGTPHRPQRGKPTEVELIGVIKHIPCTQSVTGVFNRLFLTAYSGSGLLMVC